MLVWFTVIMAIISFKGTLMQIWKSPHMFVFIQKYYPENFALLILGMFVILKPLTYCFKETIGFDLKASFASRP